MDAKRLHAEIANLHEQNNNLKAMNKQIDSQTELNRITANLASAKQAGADVEKEIDESSYGKMLRYIQRLNPFKGMFKFGDK